VTQNLDTNVGLITNIDQLSVGDLIKRTSPNIRVRQSAHALLLITGLHVVNDMDIIDFIAVDGLRRGKIEALPPSGLGISKGMEPDTSRHLHSILIGHGYPTSAESIFSNEQTEFYQDVIGALIRHAELDINERLTNCYRYFHPD
jgi:hypothetical protein